MQKANPTCCGCCLLRMADINGMTGGCLGVLWPSTPGGDRAGWPLWMQGAEKALPRQRRIAAALPKSPQANFAHGALLFVLLSLC